MLTHKLIVPCFLLYLLLHDDVHHFFAEVTHEGLDSRDCLVAVEDDGYIFGTV